MQPADRLAWQIKHARVARGWSQEALAHEAGVARAYLSMLEVARENPTLDVLEKLAAALEVDVVDLLAEPPPGAPALAEIKMPAGRKPRAR